MLTDEPLQLRDGRKLGCLEVGKSDGQPLLYNHGLPSSRLEAGLLDQNAQAAGVRLIALDRPGIGASDFRRGFKVLDWPEDVIAAADILGINRFSVLGFSAGGPFALACAHAIPDRVISCGLVSSIYPSRFMVKPAWRLLGRFPRWIIGAFVGISMRKMARSTEAEVEQTLIQGSDRLDDADRELLSEEDYRRGLVRAVVEGFQQGTQAQQIEASILVKPWDFEPEDVRAPITLWHGVDDRIVPIAAARRFASALPNCDTSFLPSAGHLSTLARHSRQILEQLESGNRMLDPACR